MNECTYIAGHSDSHDGAIVQYRGHRPMQNVQGYSGSHWTPPLGDYSLHIAASTRTAILSKELRWSPVSLKTRESLKFDMLKPYQLPKSIYIQEPQ